MPEVLSQETEIIASLRKKADLHEQAAATLRQAADLIERIDGAPAPGASAPRTDGRTDGRQAIPSSSPKRRGRPPKVDSAPAAVELPADKVCPFCRKHRVRSDNSGCPKCRRPVCKHCRHPNGSARAQHCPECAAAMPDGRAGNGGPRPGSGPTADGIQRMKERAKAAIAAKQPTSAAAPRQSAAGREVAADTCESCKTRMAMGRKCEQCGKRTCAPCLKQHGDKCKECHEYPAA